MSTLQPFLHDGDDDDEDKDDDEEEEDEEEEVEDFFTPPDNRCPHHNRPHSKRFLFNMR